MSYTYGTKGAPAVGGGAPGLPIRAVASEYTPAGTRSIYCNGVPTYDNVNDRCYTVSSVASVYTLICFSLTGDLIWSVGLSASISLETQSVGGNGIKGGSSSTVVSFSADGSLKWQTVLTGVGTLGAVQGDLADNTYVFSYTSGTNSWITKLGPTGSVVWSYSFGALTNPNTFSTHCAATGDVWLSVSHTVTNTVADAYKISAASGGTMPRLRLSYTGSNVTAGGVAVDSTGNIFFGARKSSAGYELRVINSSGTSVAAIQKASAVAGVISVSQPMAVLNPSQSTVHFASAISDGSSTQAYIISCNFTGPSTFTFVGALYNSTGNNIDSANSFSAQPFYDKSGSLWLTCSPNLLKLGEPSVGATYSRIRSAQTRVALTSDAVGIQPAFTYGYATPATSVASPSASAGAFTFTSRKKATVGKVVSDDTGLFSLQVTDA